MSTISGFQSGLTGMHRGMNALKQDAHVIASQGTENASSDKDLTHAIVDLKASTHQVEASAKTIKAQDQMLGTLLDELA